MKTLLKNIITLLASVLVTLLAIEGVLRFLPVNEGLHTQPVSLASPIIRSKENRTSTWSRFPDFSMVNTVHANNYGFINDQDYAPDDNKPLVAVIGDSYVEALMVPYAETLHGRLAERFKNTWRVYSFAASGAPLSQYLAFAGFARATFRPAKMIFVIITNDFDESLLRYKNAPGFHYFKDTPEGDLELTRVDYSPSPVKAAVRHSKLAMYLATNLQAQHLLPRLLQKKEEVAYVGQTKADFDEKRLHASQQAVDTFFELLPQYSGLSPADILFVIDGIRPDLYSDASRQAVRTSYAGRMLAYFLERANALHYPAIDMEPVFRADFKKNGKRFEFPKDGHWNGYAHGVAAGAVLDFID